MPAEELGGVLPEPIADLTGRLTRIIAADAETGAFRVTDPATAARAVFQATGRFHEPGYTRDWRSPAIEEEFTAVVDLLPGRTGSVRRVR